MIAAAPDLADLHDRLVSFCRAHTGDSEATIADLHALPAHGATGYRFLAQFRGVDDGRVEALELRLPPSAARYEGAADVRRQVRLLDVLREKDIPVPSVRWSGDDPQWFGRPYLIIPRIPGRVLLLSAGAWGASLSADTLRGLAGQAMAALARVHAIEWKAALTDWGPPLQPAEDVVRWDRLWTQVQDQELVRLGPEVRLRLLETVPAEAAIGVCHGDFQPLNLVVDGDRLSAVQGWELAGLGPVLGDLGWFTLFNDSRSWVHPTRPVAPTPEPREIEAMYAEACKGKPENSAWFHALAAYKFAVIAGVNLTLQRREEGSESQWEELAPSVPHLLRRAVEILDGAE